MINKLKMCFSWDSSIWILTGRIQIVLSDYTCLAFWIIDGNPGGAFNRCGYNFRKACIVIEMNDWIIFQIACKFLSSESTAQVGPNLVMSFVSSCREIFICDETVKMVNWYYPKSIFTEASEYHKVVYEWQSSLWSFVRIY